MYLYIIFTPNWYWKMTKPEHIKTLIFSPYLWMIHWNSELHPTIREIYYLTIIFWESFCCFPFFGGNGGLLHTLSSSGTTFSACVWLEWFALSFSVVNFINSSKSLDSNGRDLLPYFLFPITNFGESSSSCKSNKSKDTAKFNTNTASLNHLSFISIIFFILIYKIHAWSLQKIKKLNQYISKSLTYSQ